MEWFCNVCHHIVMMPMNFGRKKAPKRTQFGSCPICSTSKKDDNKWKMIKLNKKNIIALNKKHKIQIIEDVKAHEDSMKEYYLNKQKMDFEFAKRRGLIR